MFTKMAITAKTIKILWSAAGGRCSFPGCWERLCYHEAGDVSPFTLGEMAHICGEKPGANRHEASQEPKQRDDYSNLILLCPTHHTLIDRKENEATYSVGVLHTMKAAHEAAVLSRMDECDPDRERVFFNILGLIEENRQSWAQYGPRSNLAKSQPHNEAAHAVWLSERLSVIVPNNRKIAEFLNERKAVFQPDELKAVSDFLIHARSYERWVHDQIPYAAVVRFPVAFEAVIREGLNAGA